MTATEQTFTWNIYWILYAAPGHIWINENKKKSFVCAHTLCEWVCVCECVTNTLHIRIQHCKYENNRRKWKWKRIAGCMSVCLSSFSSSLEMCMKLMFENDNSNSSSTSIWASVVSVLLIWQCVYAKPKFIQYPRASFDIISLLVCMSLWELKKRLIHFYWNICYRCVCYVYRLLLFVHHSFVTEILLTAQCAFSQWYTYFKTKCEFANISSTFFYNSIYANVEYGHMSPVGLQYRIQKLPLCICLNFGLNMNIYSGGHKSLATLEFLLSEIILSDMLHAFTSMHA